MNDVKPDDRYAQLLGLLGHFLQPPPLRVSTIEKVRLDTGYRYKIEYPVEPEDPVFNVPEDAVRAYLFVPDHEPGGRLPAIIALHQDDGNRHLGKVEPAGLDQDDDQHYYYPDQKYGLELFERGYVVICPDRIGHGERRRLSPEDSAIDMERDGRLYDHQAGQLLMNGRTTTGKEAYDTMRAADVLVSLVYVDPDRIGIIGHSAGGYALVYAMFADRRIRVGASSCGFFELIEFFDDRELQKRCASSAIPGLAMVGRSADYLAYVAPRPVMLTRGTKEWMGHPDAETRSRLHVESTENTVEYAMQRYRELGAEENLKAVYFDGAHFFSETAKAQAYSWLDRHLGLSG